MILQPKLKQAEFFSTTGRTADSIGTGDPGVQLEATTDVGAGNAAAFIEDGDWISFNPYNLEDLDKVTFRVASAGAGGTIQLKFDDPDGAGRGRDAEHRPDGRLADVAGRDDGPAGHRAGRDASPVRRLPPSDATGSLMNLNWFRFAGKGAADTAPPEVTADGGARDAATRRSRWRSTPRRPTPRARR